jgi:YVTN family beta-propeller protein
MASIMVGSAPLGVSVSPDGSKVYVADGYDSVSVINSATNTVTATIIVGAWPNGVSISPDGSKVYVTNEYDETVSVINAATNTVSTTITGIHQPCGVCVSPNGSKVYVANYNDSTVNVINSFTNTVTNTIKVGATPFGMSISPDGSKVYVANGGSNSVSVINTTTNTVSATIIVGAWPNGISISPDGSKVYVTNFYSNSVSVINTNTNTVTATIAVGLHPYAFGNFISIYPNINDTICSAHYTIVPSSTPHLYYVTDSITGVPPFKYIWDWGDGTHDTIAYPSHTYNVAGSYTICFTITDSTGCTSTYCNSSYLSKALSSMIYVNVVPVVPTGINEIGLTGQIKVYPNPATNTITIESPQNAVIEITNIQGQLLKALAANSGNTNVDVSAFPSGVYIVEVKTKEGVAVKKFVKE